VTTTDRETAPPAALALAALVALAALLAVPFAHGCHGPDVDHEPLAAPQKQNREHP
jgi:MYXO-CTERM domain-containing protein